MGAVVPDRLLKRLEVHEGVRTEPRVPQQGGGVIERHRHDPVLDRPLAVLPADLEIGPDEAHRGDPPQTDKDLRAYELDLMLQPRAAGGDLLLRGVTILRRTAFDGIGDINIRFPVEIHRGEVFIEQLPPAADERLTLKVFILAGSFADEEDPRFLRTDAENDVVARFAKLTFFAAEAFLPQRFPVFGHLKPSPYRFSENPRHPDVSAPPIHRDYSIFLFVFHLFS